MTDVQVHWLVWGLLVWAIWHTAGHIRAWADRRTQTKQARRAIHKLKDELARWNKEGGC